MEAVLARAPYLLVVFLAVVGLYLMIGHRNLVKAVAGLTFFQSAVILFFIMVAFRRDGTVPIAKDHGHGETAAMVNPLPHALMLTAIVVGVATLGLAMAILRRIQQERGGVEEPGNGPE